MKGTLDAERAGVIRASLIGAIAAVALVAARGPLPSPPPQYANPEEGLPDCGRYRECHHPRTPDDFAALHGIERVLAETWRERYDCGSIPDPPARDPIALLVADVDPSPGLERVIANSRFGMIMLSATGELLAATWAIESCDDEADQTVALSAVAHAGRAYADIGHRACGTSLRYERDGDVLSDVDLTIER